MRSLLPVAVIVSVLATTSGDRLHACSTFCIDLDGRRFFGRNYDFEIGEALVMANPAGLQKSGIQAGGPTWTSRFGSVTFNQFGRDNPMGGMNEAGVVVELMWLDEARYPAPDARSPLGVLEWIQYQLDTAATVEDIVKSDRTVRIHGQVPLHYLVSDAAGRAATIEFLNGRLVVHSGDQLPVAVLTNSTYRESLAFAQARTGRSVSGSGSMERFARASREIGTAKSGTRGTPLDSLFHVLAAVAQDNTRWSIVYDQTARTIAYRTKVHPGIRLVAMKGLDFSCRAGVRMVDIDAVASGDVTKAFAPYSAAAHLAFVRRTYAGSSVTRQTSADEVRATAIHPERAVCLAGS